MFRLGRSNPVADDPLLSLLERGCRLGEQLPREIHNEDDIHRALLIIAEMDKVDAEISALTGRG